SILIGMVGLVSFNFLSMFQASFLAAGAMIVTRCCEPAEAKDNIDWSVLLVIAASLGLGNAMKTTGAAAEIAANIFQFAESSPYLALGATYLATWILTEMITNNAAAVLIFPIAIS